MLLASLIVKQKIAKSKPISICFIDNLVENTSESGDNVKNINENIAKCKKDIIDKKSALKLSSIIDNTNKDNCENEDIGETKKDIIDKNTTIKRSSINNEINKNNDENEDIGIDDTKNNIIYMNNSKI